MTGKGESKMATPTQAELLEMYNRVQGQKARDKKNTAARNEAVKKLIAAHTSEFEGYLKAAKV